MRRQDRQIQDDEELYEILAKGEVVHISFSGNNIPYILCMNYGLVRKPEDYLYLHSAAEGRKFQEILQNNLVAFQVDIEHELVGGPNPCDWGMKFRSVVGMGFMDVIVDPEERMVALASLMEHYGWKGQGQWDQATMDRTAVIRLQITEMQGKRRT